MPIGIAVISYLPQGKLIAVFGCVLGRESRRREGGWLRRGRDVRGGWLGKPLKVVVDATRRRLVRRKGLQRRLQKHLAIPLQRAVQPLERFRQPRERRRRTRLVVRVAADGRGDEGFEGGAQPRGGAVIGGALRGR